MSNKKNFLMTILILAVLFLGILINDKISSAQESRQGRYVNFDFGLLEAPMRTGIPANNLVCRQTDRYQYKCYDILRPDFQVPFNTQPQPNALPL